MENLKNAYIDFVFHDKKRKSSDVVRVAARKQNQIQFFQESKLVVNEIMSRNLLFVGLVRGKIEIFINSTVYFELKRNESENLLPIIT